MKPSGKTFYILQESKNFLYQRLILTMNLGVVAHKILTCNRNKIDNIPQQYVFFKKNLETFISRKKILNVGLLAST